MHSIGRITYATVTKAVIDKADFVDVHSVRKLEAFLGEKLVNRLFSPS